MAGQQETSLFSRSPEVDAAGLFGVMQTRSSFPECLPGYEGMSCGFDRLSLGLNCDEVYPNVFIGDAACARNKDYLVRIGVSHVLNAAEGTSVGMANTNAAYYDGLSITYMGLPVVDDPAYEISAHFQTAAEFVRSGIVSGGKVLVHCVRGQSRSACLVIAYLMMEVGMPAPMALSMCCAKLPVNINLGFLFQLATLHNSLRTLIPQ